MDKKIKSNEEIKELLSEHLELLTEQSKSYVGLRDLALISMEIRETAQLLKHF